MYAKKLPMHAVCISFTEEITKADYTANYKYLYI